MNKKEYECMHLNIVTGIRYSTSQIIGMLVCTLSNAAISYLFLSGRKQSTCLIKKYNDIQFHWTFMFTDLSDLIVLTNAFVFVC